MRPLLILAVISFLPATSFAAPLPAAQALRADWRRDGVDARVKEALTGQGWRLEDDGRALDPKTKAPVTKPVLEKAILDLRQGARRAALENVNILLASGKPLTPADRETINTLSPDLPPALVASILDPKSDINTVKAMAAADLSRVAAYFDGGMTLADRQAAAQPVSVGTPGPRTDLPYFTAQEQSVGEKIRAEAQAVIGRDPFGKIVLARLDTNGKPDLPHILIEDQSGSVTARYDIRRRAIVLDREVVLSSIVGAVPPRQASALRASLTTRAALLLYLETHPEAVAAVVRDNDVVIVHELTHAWQDRRESVFREIARGNIPDTQPLEYEEEAYVTKNLYIKSKIENDPASVLMDSEFRDFIAMAHGVDSWRRGLLNDLLRSSPSRAIPLKSIREIQRARLHQTRSLPVVTREDQQMKALSLVAIGRGARELRALQAAHAQRMAPLNADIRIFSGERSNLLGSFYLGRALTTANPIDRAALLDQAARYARVSRNAKLIEDVRKAKEQ